MERYETTIDMKNKNIQTASLDFVILQFNFRLFDEFELLKRTSVYLKRRNFPQIIEIEHYPLVWNSWFVSSLS